MKVRHLNFTKGRKIMGLGNETLPKEIENCFTEILRDELKAALGCTEPISIAFCAAYARVLLGSMPEICEIACSGNIIKNVKAVTVPETAGMKGIEPAVLAGIVCGRPELEMEVLSCMTAEKREELKRLLEKNMVRVSVLDTNHPLHFILTLKTEMDSVSVEIIDSHMRLGEVWKNGKRHHDSKEKMTEHIKKTEAQFSVKNILSYAEHIELEEVSALLERQVSCNISIAREGLKHDWGAGVGQTIMERGQDIYSRLCAVTAAGSDARMNGCPMPVVINSGSGNQGLTVSVPVALYAQYRNCSDEMLHRALCVANLVAVYQKACIGKLSAFCGAVSAAAGAVCGIAFLDGARDGVIEQTLINTVASVGGMVCDGAKSSCASKISIALYSAFLGYELARKEKGFRSGEGIVGEDVEKTISNIGRMASQGMKSTDKEILKIMLGE